MHISLLSISLPRTFLFKKGWFSNTSFTTGLKTLPTFPPDALVFFRAKIFVLKKTRASGRNVGKVFNPVVKLVLENQPFLMPEPAEKPSLHSYFPIAELPAVTTMMSHITDNMDDARIYSYS